MNELELFDIEKPELDNVVTNAQHTNPIALSRANEMNFLNHTKNCPSKTFKIEHH